MQVKKTLRFTEIPVFLKENERFHDEYVVPKMVALIGDTDVDSLMRRPDARGMCVDMPYCEQMSLQKREKAFVQSLLNGLWEDPLSKCGFGGKDVGSKVFTTMRDLMVRYLRINEVIGSNYKEYVVDYGDSYVYTNFKGYWYRDDGTKYRGINFNYGVSTEGKSSVTPLVRLYKDMGYHVHYDPAKSKFIIVSRGDKEWMLVVKPRLDKNHKKMLMNHKMWDKYREDYPRLLSTGVWS